jgi:ABC-2 type transport system ATP-binding protein
MMKIITCYLPQTSGKVSVCGHDVEEETMQVRKKIGYLPEHNPQYLEMYIKEYLAFVAGIHQIKSPKKRIAEMIDLVGLEIEQHKKIGALSKGYRQRVGLAQALIHNPEVLILDEPTTGLDPNQIVDIRNLIREIGKEKTVMMSTHIMQEVEAICNRVIIINKGEIVADNPTHELQNLVKGKQIIHVRFENSIDINDIRKIKGVSFVNQKGNMHFEIEHSSKENVAKSLFYLAVEKNNPLLEVASIKHDLEDVFQNLTRKKNS